MQSKDIKVGEVYAYARSTNRRPYPVRVITAPEKIKSKTYPFAVRSVVQVQSVDATTLEAKTQDGRPHVAYAPCHVTPRQLGCTWAAYVEATKDERAQQAEIEEARVKREQERSDLAVKASIDLEAVNLVLEARGFELVKPSYGCALGEVAISVADLRKITTWIAGPELDV